MEDGEDIIVVTIKMLESFANVSTLHSGVHKNRDQLRILTSIKSVVSEVTHMNHNILFAYM